METEELDSKITRIGIIGGGQDSIDIMEILGENDFLSLDFLADPNASAPGFKKARQAGVRTFQEVGDAVSRFTVDLIITATGSADVLGELDADNAAKVISAQTALLFHQILDADRKKVNQQVSADITQIKNSITKNTKDVDKALHGIDKVAADLEVLAVNAGIQAARAAQFGVGFAVVAGEVKSTARIAKGLAQDIERVNEEVMSMSDKIDNSLAKLK